VPAMRPDAKKKIERTFAGVLIREYLECRQDRDRARRMRKERNGKQHFGGNSCDTPSYRENKKKNVQGPRSSSETRFRTLVQFFVAETKTKKTTSTRFLKAITANATGRGQGKVLKEVVLPSRLYAEC